MLKVIEYGKDTYEFPCLIVLGCFDAIHLGHRELLKKAKLQAKINGLDLGVMVFKEGKGGKLVYSFEERAAILEQYNVKFVLAVDFNDEFKKIAPIDFLNSLEERINVKAFMSGKDFRFGAQAKGKSSTLKNYAEDDENGVWYMPIKDVDLNGEKISTTLIKKCLDEGDVKKANDLLGSEFSVTGEVVKGAGRGTSVVGYPTVNIEYPAWKYPLKFGVYGVKCTIDEVEYSGVANFGTCPTFGDERVVLEVYFENFSGDLYGRTLQIRFDNYIRDIETFGSAEELSAQLETDVKTANAENAVVEEVVAEEVTEEAVEQPAEEPTEVVEVEEQPAEVIEEVEQPEEPTEVVEEVQEDGLDEVVEEVTEEPAEEVAEEVAEEPAEEVREEVEEVTEEVVEDETAAEIAEEVVESAEEDLTEGEVEITEESVVTEDGEITEENVTDDADEIIEENVATDAGEIAEESVVTEGEVEITEESVVTEDGEATEEDALKDDGETE